MFFKHMIEKNVLSDTKKKKKLKIWIPGSPHRAEQGLPPFFSAEHFRLLTRFPKMKYVI
jgi:hypothetical protein